MHLDIPLLRKWLPESKGLQAKKQIVQAYSWSQLLNALLVSVPQFTKRQQVFHKSSTAFSPPLYAV